MSSFDPTCRSPGESLPRSAVEHDRVAIALRLALDRVVVPLSYAASGVVRTRASKQLGYARIEDHARERFGRTGRWLRDLAKLGSDLAILPALAAALDGSDGDKPIGRVAARAVTDVATPDDAAVWASLARELTLRELKLAVTFGRETGMGRRRTAPATATGQIAVIRPGATPSITSERGSGASRAGRITPGVVRRTEIPLSGAPGDMAGIDEAESGCRAVFAAMTSARAGSTFSTSREPACAAAPGEQGDGPAEPPERFVRIAVPQPVKAMFDETVDLYRHVEGFDGGIASFVEALIAEAYAGPAPPDEELPAPGSRPRRPEPPVRSAELPEPTADGAARLAHDSLLRFQRVARRAGAGGPVDLDAQVRTLLRLEEQLQAQLGRVLCAMDRRRDWAPLGFHGLGQYAEERLGIPRRTLQSRARLARQLDRRPRLREAYESGELGFEKTRTVVRALGTQPCTPELEDSWVSHARIVTVKRLRDEVRELNRRALGLPSRPASSPLDDATWQRSLRCEAGSYRRRVRELGRMALEDPRVDVFLRLRLSAELAGPFLGSVEAHRRMLAERAGMVESSTSGQQVPRTRHLCGTSEVVHSGAPFSVAEAGVRAAADVETGPATDPGADIDRGVPVALLLARWFVSNGTPVPSWVGLVGMLEDFADTWDTQPVRRRFAAVYGRDGMRCTASGCTSRRNLEDHHIVFRSRGGGDEPQNRTTSCRFHHHLGAHGRFGECSGNAPLGVRWRLGRREFGSWHRNERLLEDPTLEYTGEIAWWVWRKKRAGSAPAARS